MNDTANEPETDPAADVELLEKAAEAGEESAPASDVEVVPAPAPDSDSEPDSAPEPEPEREEPALTLDELVADLAESEAVAETAVIAPEVDEAAAEPTEAATETAASAGVPDVQAEPKPLLRRLWTQAPFWAVDAVWAILTLAAVIALWRAPSATFADGIAYGLLVLGGAALAFIGLVTGLVVWLVARSRAGDDERAGLGLAIWTRALAWTAGGVALWWVGLLVLDLHHAGVIG